MRRIADINCLFFRDGSTAALDDSYCDETEIVHTAGLPGADAHNVSTVVSCAHGTGGRDLSSTGGLHSFVMDHLLCSICKARAGLMPALVFLRRTVGGRGVCVAQTCTDARSAHKTAHIGTTRPTPRTEWLRRCAFSDLCRSSAVNLPSGGGIWVRVLPASCVLVPKRDACAFLAQQEKPKRRQILVLFRRIFRFSFCTSHEIQHFCASDFVVATLVAMEI